MPIQPNEPSCQAISIQVSIMSRNDGSIPPAATGFMACMSPLSHMPSTTGAVIVRRSSDAAASPRTRSRSPRARSRVRRESVVVIEGDHASMTAVVEVRAAVRRTFGSLDSRNYRLLFTGQLISQTGGWMHTMAEASPDARFFHCLPAHRGDEVAAEVIDGPRSAVIAQGHNRLHAARGLLAFLMGVRP